MQKENNVIDVGGLVRDTKAVKEIQPNLREIGQLLIEMSNTSATNFSHPLPDLRRTSDLRGGESDFPLLARMAREEHNERASRTKFLDAGIYGEPGWNMLLDLYANKFEGRQISITSACIASGAPPTTALRHVSNFVDQGLVHRWDDPADQRRSWLDLTDFAYNALSNYLSNKAEMRYKRQFKAERTIARTQS